MDSARWDRIQSLFHHAADLPHEARLSFLREQCGDDPDLLSDVAALLEHDASSSSLLDDHLARIADRILDTASATPAQIGPYRVRGVLGEGGMGVVYLAEREELNSLVAIKLLLDASLSPSRRVRFAREQRTLAQLNHPGIARLYDADTLPDGTPYFVMEYVDGHPLNVYCDERGVSIADRLRLFRSVCEAVQYAHSHAVIHRDLKPSNILVKTDGTARLLDFGIAKQVESLDLAAVQTLTALRLMTPAYAAPEQFRGARVGVQTDVYSLGVILYELLTGRLPFDLSGRSPREAESMILEHEPVKPSSLARRREPLDLPASNSEAPSWSDLDVLCLKAMQKDPERRYRSAEALIRDIDHYLKAEPLEARPDSFSYRTGKFIRRNRRAVLIAASVFLLVITMAVVFTVRLTIARNQALAEAARTQRIQRFMLNLFEGGEREVGPSESLRVISLLDRGTQEAQALNGDPETQAELYMTLGRLYQQLGNFDRADELLKKALEQRRNLFGTQHPKVAETIVAISILRLDQAKLEEAETLARNGLAMSQDTLPKGDAVVALATDTLGRVLEERGSYDEAVRVLEEAVRLRSAEGENSSDLAASLFELANTHFYAGHYAESDHLNRRALAIYTALHGETHPLVADVLINLGAIQFELGNNSEAEAFYRRALKSTEEWFGKDHYKTAANLTMLGRVLVREARYDEAKVSLDHALAIQQKVYGNVHPRVASTVNELASVELLSKRLDSAESGYRRMAEIYRAVYGDNHYLVAVALSNIASVQVERKNYDEAERTYREAIDRFTRSLSADHLNTGIARIKLGRALVRGRKFTEAEKEILAGYQILSRETNPQVSFLRAAREDLVQVYEATNRPEQASRYRDELRSSVPGK